jgi:predicted phosphodiesterase
VVTLDIQSDKIEKDLKILLVSDIHVDYVLSTLHLKTIGQLIEKENPDMVIIA